MFNVDICLGDRTRHDVLLLVPEDKRYQEKDPNDSNDPIPQLIAEALAGITFNNNMRLAVGEATV